MGYVAIKRTEAGLPFLRAGAEGLASTELITVAIRTMNGMEVSDTIQYIDVWLVFQGPLDLSSIVRRTLPQMYPTQDK